MRNSSVAEIGSP